MGERPNNPPEATPPCRYKARVEEGGIDQSTWRWSTGIGLYIERRTQRFVLFDNTTGGIWHSRILLACPKLKNGMSVLSRASMPPLGQCAIQPCPKSFDSTSAKSILPAKAKWQPLGACTSNGNTCMPSAKAKTPRSARVSSSTAPSPRARHRTPSSAVHVSRKRWPRPKVAKRNSRTPSTILTAFKLKRLGNATASPIFRKGDRQMAANAWPPHLGHLPHSKLKNFL